MQSIRNAGGLLWWLILLVVHGEGYTDHFHRQALQDVHSSNYTDAAAPSPVASEQMLVHGGTDMTRIGTASSSSSNHSSSSKASAGVNVLAVMLVTASSVMVFLVLRLSLCQWHSSNNNSNGASSEEAVGTTAPATAVDESRKHGLGQDVIDKFTVLVDYSSLLGAMASNSSSSLENVRSCTVCLSEFAAEDSKIRILPACNHSFHTECIDLWLFSHRSCPLCRGSLVPIPEHSRASVPVVLEVPVASSSAADDAEGVQSSHPESNHLVLDIK